MDVDADADDDVANARDLGIQFGEDAAEFAWAEEQIVRPAEVGLERGDGLDGAVDGEAGCEREPEDVGGSDAGAKEDADVQAGGGRRGPGVRAAATS